MGSPLDHLLEEGIITEVVGRLQSGKEAEVFIVRFGERVVAAKVYKDRSQRSFKNNSDYKEGRSVRNTRDQRAMGRRSRFGKATEEEAWKSAEADALYRLHAADVRVPTPVLFFEGVLLMELVLDADGITARRLIDTALSVEQANAAYHDMLKQLVRMLACDLIHGDLSPYNVLWAAAGVTIIDFPQIVSAAQNSNSERFFLRDAENILGHLRQIDPRLDARRGDATEIWRAYMRRELTADFMPSGRLRPPPPQRPLPIGAPRTQAQPPRFAAPARHHASAQPERSHGNPRQPARPPGNGQQTRPPGNGQQTRPPGNGQQTRPPGNGQQQARGDRPQQQRQRDPRPAGQPQQQQQARGSGPQQPRSHANAPHQRQAARPSYGNAQARRPMPEVIVRPRVTAGAPPDEPRATSPSETAAQRELDQRVSKRRD